MKIRWNGISARRTPSRLVWMVAFVVMGCVTLGSLTPFRFNLAAAAATGGIVPIGWPSLKIADVVTNFVVYLPVGAVLAMLLRGRLGRLRSVAVASFAGVGLSLVLEATQALIVTRYASWYDVIVNAVGTVVGAVAVCALEGRTTQISVEFRRQLHRRPAETLARLATVAVLLHALMPFDFVSSAEELASSLRQARLPMLATIQAGRLIPEGPTPYVAGLSETSAHDWFLASVFMMVGGLTALARREHRDRLAAAASGAGAGWIMAILIGSLHVFTVHHTFDIFVVFLNGVAATLGAFLAWLVMLGQVWSGDARGPVRKRLAIPTSFLLMFWIVQTALGVAIGAPKFAGALHGAVQWTFNWQPFVEYFHQPFGLAVASMLEVGLAFVLLTLTAHLLIRRLDGLGPVGMMVVVVTSGAGICVILGSNTVSISDILIAVCCVALTVSATRWARFEQRRSVTPDRVERRALPRRRIIYRLAARNKSRTRPLRGQNGSHQPTIRRGLRP